MEAIKFTREALDDLKFWQKSGNTIILKRIRQLLQAIDANPFIGIGKPETLKHHLSDFWSRRINQEHRIVYKVQDQSDNRLFAPLSLPTISSIFTFLSQLLTFNFSQNCYICATPR